MYIQNYIRHLSSYKARQNITHPFVDEISGLAIVKMLDNKEQCTVVLEIEICEEPSIIRCHKHVRNSDI